METKMTQMIPLGRSKEDIKAREQIIKDFNALTKIWFNTVSRFLRFLYKQSNRPNVE